MANLYDGGRSLWRFDDIEISTKAELSVMNLVDPQKYRYSIVLISQDRAKAETLMGCLASIQILREQMDFLWAKEINELVAVDLSAICGVLFDSDSTVFGSDELDARYKEIEQLRSLKSECNFAFFATAEGVNPIEELALLSRSGIDVVIKSKNVECGLLKVFGVLRLLQSIVDRRRSKFEREDITLAKIGKWVLLPRFRSIRLPDGSRKKLTEAEWGYLLYLFDRDVRKVMVAENSTRRFEEEINQKLLVYKLKKKLGADFPIFSEGSGRYLLRIVPEQPVLAISPQARGAD